MNKVILIGNLTKDPELNTVGTDGISVCRFSIAVNRRFTAKDGNREVDFFNITAWRGLGENCAKFIKKGSKVGVSGEIRFRNYEDKDGNKRIATDIIADEVEFLDRKGEPVGGGNNDYNAPVPTDTTDTGDEMRPVTDDSLPF
ncbi:MAG: single-stranded DNA-binding protein [Christensenellaceae bacterium]|jgi:single-strand DNA-binding protein|nr:single-stranded DNA-binding protein [Christensenellaceae bacterium]